MGGKGSGRKRKSIEHHLAAGTYRKDRHGPLPSQLTGSRFAPPAPDGLDAYECVAYAAMNKTLANRGNQPDAAALTCFAVLYCRRCNEDADGDLSGHLAEGEGALLRLSRGTFEKFVHHLRPEWDEVTARIVTEQDAE